MAVSSASCRAECQRYLIEFRVIELKELLKALGLSQKGRKQDLFHRVNDLLMHGSSKIQHEIQRIYDKSHRLKRTPRFGKMTHKYSYSDMEGRYRTTKSELGISSYRREEGSFILHPDVVFKPHPFYEVIDTIIRPTALVSTAVTSNGSCSMRLQFHLTPQQVQMICSSRTAQGTYGIQILLRFARKESSCEQEDFYPKQCYVKVNNNGCTLPNYNPNLSLRPDYRRHGSPVNITNLVKTSASQANDVTFYWIPDILYSQGFCIVINLVKSLSSSDLLQRLKLKGVRSPEVSRALVREKLAVDRDLEISATSLRVSILCPLGKLRMTHPCRSQICTHLQCFDASIYLQMNERKARWVCPVCDKPAPMEILVIDGLFKEICAESASNDVEFYSDGSWHPITANDTLSHTLTPERRLQRVDNHSPVVLSDSGDSSTKGEGTVSDPIVIDLTSDDEEDEQSIILSSAHSPSPAPTTTHTSASSSSSMPHIVTSGSIYRPHSQLCTDSSSRSVVVKRRCSSTDGGLDANELPITSVSTNARPVPVITEYAPSLPLFRPVVPFLVQPTVQTVLASSDYPRHTGLNGAHNLDDLHLPSLNFEDNILNFIPRAGSSRITLIDD